MVFIHVIIDVGVQEFCMLRYRTAAVGTAVPYRTCYDMATYPCIYVYVVATASFPLINLPNFYLSFTILVSLILVKYPDRVGLVNTVP